MKPYLHQVGRLMQLQWNLDCSVGQGGQNNLIADVSYIQWYYTLAAVHPNTPQERKDVYCRVSVNGSCKGTPDDPLVKAILVHQATLKHPTIDGKVSVAAGTGKLAGKAFFILRLGARLSDMYPEQWPRLDLIPRCPPPVADVVRACVPRVSV